MIYGWSPTIGDPGILGWVTVLAYFGTAAIAYLAAVDARRQALTRPATYYYWLRTGRFWMFLAILLTGLGINKQLDLQSLLTAVGRHLAKEQGWYAERHGTQRAFIVSIVVAGAALTASMLMIVRKLDHWVKLAGAGLVILVSFIIIRAASFHHIDVVLRTGLAGFRINHVLELGGISLIAVAAICSAKREPS